MKKPPKKKFKKIAFKLSDKQFGVIMRFCKSKKLTPNKVFKKAIRDYIVNNYDFNDSENYISENQLALFDLEDENDDIDNNDENIEEHKTTLF